MDNLPPPLSPSPSPTRTTTPPPPPPPDTPSQEGRSSYHSRASSSDGKTPRSKRHSKKKEKRAAEKAAAAAQQEFLRQLTSLQLPHMPKMSMDAMNNHMNNNKNEPPTLRILVVADIDLASASALAESALAASEEEEANSNGGGGDSTRNFQNSYSSVRGGSGGANGVGGSDGRNSSSSNLGGAGGGGSGGRKEEGEPNLLNRVDLCIACGPFCREEDLRQYYQGRQRRRHYQRTNAYASSMKPFSGGGGGAGSYPHNPARAARTNFYPSGNNSNAQQHSQYPPYQQQASYSSPYHQQPRHHHNHHHHNNTSHHHHGNNHYHHHPLRRTREETAALEGLMTAALSQLESIVCRVIFVPGRSDPISTITSQPSGNSNANSYNTQLPYTKERRLTPNSRNIHRHWTALGPGLGCGGLLYLDWQRLQQPPPLEDGDEDEDDDDDDDEDDDDDDDSSSSSTIVDESGNTFHGDEPNKHHHLAPNPPEAGVEGDSTPDDLPPMADHSETPSQQYAERAQQYGTEFCKTLERLVQLAPPTSAVTDTPTNSQITSLLKTSLFQSILVTHFHHLEPDEEDEDDLNYNGDMSINSSFGGNYNGSYSNLNTPLGPRLDGSGITGQTPVEGGSCNEENQAAAAAAAAGYGEEESDEEEEESFDPPWPTEHEAFCALPLVQEHVILEIASGLNSSGSTLKPMELPKGKVRVVLPGSLRERGEFCLVDVAFMKDPYQPRTNDYRWRVRKTRFQTINEFL